MQLTVDFGEQPQDLPHFWRSTGFTPASLLLNADMRQTMQYAGSIPNRGIGYVRIHYLLDLVTATGFGTNDVRIDWSVLDTALDVLVDNDLMPIFELMGNPSGYFTDFTDDTQAQTWRKFVYDLAIHYIERYGLDTVRRWYFETWNEPDIGWWSQSNEAFMIYYDACSEGLYDVDPQLKLGGPGSARTLSPLFKAFLQHCDTGTNYFTGKTGVRLDFISVHEKGVRASPEDLNPDSMAISKREIDAVDYIRTHHPRLRDVPFMNNECDPQVGWKDHHTWRARPYYASMICKIIHQHITHLIDNHHVDYLLLGNDHGFVGEWGHRTLLARFGEIQDTKAQAEFQMQATDRQEDINRRRFEALKKPALNVFALMSLLGDKRYPVQGVDEANNVGIIATQRDQSQVAILLYHSDDTIISYDTKMITLAVDGLPFEEATFVHYRIDETHGNPFDVWETMGAPHVPSREQFDQLRRHQEIPLLDAPKPVRCGEGKMTLTFEMPLHAVSLLVLTVKPDLAPPAPTHVRLDPYDGLGDQQQVMVMWTTPTDVYTIRTYEVLCKTSDSDRYVRVNPVNLICNAFLHVLDTPVAYATYKVCAVDYWGRRTDSPAITMELR